MTFAYSWEHAEASCDFKSSDPGCKVQVCVAALGLVEEELMVH